MRHEQIDLDEQEGAEADRWLKAQGHDWNKEPTRPDVQSAKRLKDLGRREATIDMSAEPTFAGKHADPRNAHSINAVADAFVDVGTSDESVGVTVWPDSPPRTAGKPLGYKHKK